MKLLLLILVAVFGPLTSPQPGVNAMLRTIPYMVYMPRYYTPGLEFYIYVLIPTATAPTFTYEIRIDGNLIGPLVLPPRIQVFKIHDKSFGPSRQHKIQLKVKDNRNTTLIFETLYISNDWRAKTPEKALFIQQDKPLYKPNDKVRFRCFGLDDQLEVIKYPLDIKLYDPKNNLMKIWNQAVSPTGVFSGDVQLSDQPVLGKWSLKIKQNYTENKVSFDVKEFVLPPIKVTVTGDEYVYHLSRPAIYLTKHYIDISVDARYSFGGPVNGELTLRASMMTFQKISVETKTNISGSLKIRFPLKKFLTYNKISLIPAYSYMPRIYSFDIVAVVTERETGLKTESSPMKVTIAATPINIDAPFSVAIKPFSTKISVRVKYEDGRPLTIDDIKTDLNVTYTFDKKVISEMVKIPMDGHVTFNAKGDGLRKIKVSYSGIYQDCRYIRSKYIRITKFVTPSNEHVRVSLREIKKYQAGNVMKMRLQSSTALNYVYYWGLKNNELSVVEGIIPVMGLTFDFNLSSREDWFPGVTFIFTCLTTTDQILVDVLPVKLDANFRYKVEGGFSPKNNSAKLPTTLRMTSEPNSVLFLMSVDERLHYLKENKYINKEDIFSELAGSFDVRIPYAVNSIPGLLRHYNLEFRSNRIKSTFHRRPMPMDLERPLPIMEMMRMPAIGGNAKKETSIVRDNFQDVWIWAEAKVPSNGILSLKEKTPDSITTWKTNAFAVHPKKGISVLEKPLEFVSIQKMFIKLDLPYSVIRGETLSIVAIVFNYLKVRMKVNVSISGSALKFLKGNQDTIMVEAGNYKSIRFAVRAEKVGDEIVEMILRSGARNLDHIKKILIVKPEGRPLYFSEELQIDLCKGGRIVPYKINIPTKGVVPNSVRIEVSVMVDIMGPAIENLGNYVRLPRGCGEQTALSLVPNIVIFNYLNIRKALDSILKLKLIRYTESGYKNQLRFQRWDGSFSAFERDMKGSEWLTAFIAEAFHMVIDSKMGVFIDIEKLKQSVKWLISKQQPNGSFKETGRVIHKEMQGGAGEGHAMTAYVVNALHSLRSYDSVAADKATSIAMQYMDTLDFGKLDVYTLSIYLYTYAKLKRDKQFDKIEAILKIRVTRGKGLMYWKGDNEIEQTAYVLLAYSTRKYRSSDVHDIFRWLLSKRTSLGGYSNTQDTIVALKAMSAYALLFEASSQANVSVRSDCFTLIFDTITSYNKYIVQKKTVPNTLREFYIIASGENHVYVRFSWQYNVLYERDDNFGLLVTATTQLISRDLFKVCICYTWKKAEDSGMIVSEVAFPSGFGFRSLGCKPKSCYGEILKIPGTTCWDKYETKKDGLALYMDDLDMRNPICSEILSNRQFKVENGDASMYITTRQYYNARTIVTSFNPFKSLGGNNNGTGFNGGRATAK